MNPNVIILTNLMNIRNSHDLSAYEQDLYNQLLVTLKAKARLDEIICRTTIKDLQDGARDNQTPGGTPPPAFEAEEHRGDDPPAPI